MPCRLHRVLGGQEAAERAHAERRMRVGVAGGKLAYAVARLSIGHRRLALAGHGVIFGIAGEGRASAVATSARGRRSACRPFRARPQNPRAAQPVHVPRRGFVFAPRRLVEIPDRHVIARQRRRCCVQPIERALLRRVPFACLAMASDLVADQRRGRAMEAAAAGDHLVIGNGDHRDAVRASRSSVWSRDAFGHHHPARRDRERVDDGAVVFDGGSR